MKLLLQLIFITISLYSCRGAIKHEDFSALSDYEIYVDEVKSEPIQHGRVEYLDTTIMKEHHKESMKNIYLLYYDSICIAVYNQHPKNNFRLIEQFIKRYRTDSSRLSDFVKFDDGIRITLSRFCEDKSNKWYFGKYAEWKVLNFDFQNDQYIFKEEIIMTDGCSW